MWQINCTAYKASVSSRSTKHMRSDNKPWLRFLDVRETNPQETTGPQKSCGTAQRTPGSSGILFRIFLVFAHGDALWPLKGSSGACRPDAFPQAGCGAPWPQPGGARGAGGVAAGGERPIPAAGSAAAVRALPPGWQHLRGARGGGGRAVPAGGPPGAPPRSPAAQHPPPGPQEGACP
ncbi:hypothetical protein NDU88_008552 [Pleurodeles waltl]|uniref:Uncharacterized protein n=1 Tax=Pleurodeles waltl TaxID=8319 RepID=A0AAV7RVT3_PLEWA|nr:hypothetical protein NDU88_008552 [Pleurodeles waltl]